MRQERSVSARFFFEDSYRFARSGWSEALASLPSTELLSWGSSKMPLHRHHLVSPLPNEPSLVLRCAACQAAHSFRPCRSTRLRRFPPHHAPQVCCTLQPVMGFAVFRCSLVGPKSHATEPSISSTAHALRSFSLASSRTASPRPFPSRCWTGLDDPRDRSLELTDSLLNLKVLLHWRSRCERSAVASRVLHVASMGFSFWDALWPDPPLQRATDAWSRANP
jgi:hypothetical protein